MRRPEYEEPPVTLERAAFPMGDITSADLTAMADGWFETVGTYDSARFENYIKFTSRSKQAPGSAGVLTHEAALDLCEDWDYHRGDITQCVRRGYLIARSFQEETHFLPICDVDLSEQFEEMGENDIREKKMLLHRVEKARIFGEAAWHGMAHSHPHVFAQFQRLLELARRPYGLDFDEGETYFIAGMMLVYMSSLVSELERLEDTGNQRATYGRPGNPSSETPED